jgi:hypothetical protein
MAYGRLDVFWPDGAFKTFPLTNPNTSIGRSSGNTILLDTTTISRYHCSIILDNDQVYLSDMDSANGTYVDGVKLKGTERKPLYGGEEIQIGNLRIIYHYIDTSPTKPILPVDDTTQRIALTSPNFRIDLEAPDQGVAPGAHISAQLLVVNTSQQTERYAVEVTGIPREWVRTDRPELQVDPEDAAQVMINFKPLRRSDSKPGDYAVKIRVYPKSEPAAVLEASMSVRILPYNGFGIAIEPRRLNPDGRFRVYIHNQGSGNLPLSITGRDYNNSLTFNIHVPQVTLNPGQRLTIQGEVKPKNRPIFGSPRIYPFDIVAHSNDQAGFIAAVRAHYLEKPAMPGWTPLALGAGIVGIALIFIVGLLFFLRPAPQPVITAFNVSSTQIAPGTPLVVNWQATNVDQVNVSINGTPYALDVQEQGITLDTADLQGTAVISLNVNGQTEAIASQVVMIEQPVGVDYFVAEPNTLVRYTVSSLTLRWNVPGAVSTRIGGLEAFSALNQSLQTDFGSQGELANIAIIPTDPFSLTLYATDEQGATLEQPITIDVINPMCAPATPSVSLHAGPDTSNQIVGTVQAGQEVIVDAQDEGGQWLRVQLAGGVTGWGPRNQFICAENFAVESLRKELDVPQPPTQTTTPTRALSPTPRPTLTPTRTPPGVG